MVNDKCIDVFSGLFPDKDTKLPKYPYFVTAISSAYFLKGKCLARHVLQLRARYPEIKLVVFNLGLTRAEEKEVGVNPTSFESYWLHVFINLFDDLFFKISIDF